MALMSLSHNSTGNRNTAEGMNALFGNTTGNNNTASGEAALFVTQPVALTSPWALRLEVMSL